MIHKRFAHADYGTFTNAAFQTTFTDTVIWDTSLRTHSATIGIAYKFGGPVVARY
jgi:outer membrane immunogenic protein